jgi:rsbT co-antagonist protein RsbR
MVAHEIIKIVNSLSLLGVKAILTGIRPKISRTIINLGINFDTESRGTLKQAIPKFVVKQK